MHLNKSFLRLVLCMRLLVHQTLPALYRQCTDLLIRILEACCSRFCPVALRSGFQQGLALLFFLECPCPFSRLHSYQHQSTGYIGLLAKPLVHSQVSLVMSTITYHEQALERQQDLCEARDTFRCSSSALIPLLQTPWREAPLLLHLL